LPLSLPCPERTAIRDLYGVIPRVDPFAAANPHMRVARLPGDGEDTGRPIRTIRLIKSDDAPSHVAPIHLSIHTSDTNNHFQHYAGPKTITETIEVLPGFPRWQRCRVLTFKDLAIPADQRFIV